MDYHLVSCKFGEKGKDMEIKREKSCRMSAQLLKYFCCDKYVLYIISLT